MTNSLKMENFFVKPDEIVELIKKRYEYKNDKEINIDDISSTEIDNFVINCEVDRFADLFNRVFEEEILPFEKSTDCEDGSIDVILLKIISSIKESFDKIDKEKLLKFLFKLITNLILKKEEE